MFPNWLGNFTLLHAIMHAIAEESIVCSMVRRRKDCVGWKGKDGGGKEVQCRMERRRKDSVGWREEGRIV